MKRPDVGNYEAAYWETYVEDVERYIEFLEEVVLVLTTLQEDAWMEEDEISLLVEELWERK